MSRQTPVVGVILQYSSQSLPSRKIVLTKRRSYSHERTGGWNGAGADVGTIDLPDAQPHNIAPPVSHKTLGNHRYPLTLHKAHVHQKPDRLRNCGHNIKKVPKTGGRKKGTLFPRASERSSGGRSFALHHPRVRSVWRYAAALRRRRWPAARRR